MAYCACCLLCILSAFSCRAATATATIDPPEAAIQALLSDDGGRGAVSFVQLRAAQISVEEDGASEEEAHTALMGLWDGMDISEQQMSKVELQSERAAAPARVVDGFMPSFLQNAKAYMPSWLVDVGNMLIPTFSVSEPKAKYVQILGLFDTGTNLLEKMIMLNFPNLQAKSYHQTSPFIWKHADVGAEAIANAINRSLPNTSSMSDVVVVAMVRSPISNVVSLRKAPYNIQQCVQRSYKDMGKPCVGFVSDVHGQGRQVQSWPEKTFNSTMDVYNSYLRQYRDLQKLGEFKDVLIVSYEDLVMDPLLVMKQLAEATGQELPADVLVMSIKAKSHGASVSRQEAMDKLRKRAYLNEFNNDQTGLEVLCRGLNRSLVKDLAEGSFRNAAARVPYTQDCDRLLGAPEVVEPEEWQDDVTPFADPAAA